MGDFLPRDLHEIEVTGLLVLDLTAPLALVALGVELSELLGDDLELPQQIAEAASRLHFHGIRAASATGEGNTIAVFEEQIGRAQLKIIGTTTLPTL